MIGSNLSLRMPMDISHEIVSYLPHQDKWRFLYVVKDLDAYTTQLEKFKLDRRWSELFAQYSAWCLKENPLPEILTRCTWYSMPLLNKEIREHLSNLCENVVKQDDLAHIKTVIKLAKQVPLCPNTSTSSLAEVYFPWGRLLINIKKEIFPLWASGNKEQALEIIHAIDSYSRFERDSILCSIAEKFMQQENYEAAESVLDLVTVTRLKDHILYGIFLEYVTIGSIDKAQRLADSLHPDDPDCEERDLKSRALADLCSHFLSTHHYLTARKIADSIQKKEIKFEALCEICMEYLDTIADYDTAVDIAKSMSDPTTEMQKFWKNRAIFPIFLKFLEKKCYDRAIDIAASISDEHRSKALASIGLHCLIQRDASKARSIANLISEDSQENRILKTYLLYMTVIVYLNKRDHAMAIEVANTMLQEEISNHEVGTCLHCTFANTLANTLIGQISYDFWQYNPVECITAKKQALTHILISSIESNDIATARNVAHSFEEGSSSQFVCLQKIVSVCLNQKNIDNLLSTCSALFGNYQCFAKSCGPEENNDERRGELSSIILEKVIPKLLEDNDVKTARKVAHLIPSEMLFSELSAKALAMIGK